MLGFKEKATQCGVHKSQPGHSVLYLEHQTHQATVTCPVPLARWAGTFNLWVTLMGKPILRKPTVDL